MSKYKDRDRLSKNQQQNIAAELALQNTNSLPLTSKLEIRYGDLTSGEQPMADESFTHHLAMALYEEKVEHAKDIIIPFLLRNAELAEEANYQLDILKARAARVQDKKRVVRSINKCRERIDQILPMLEELLVARVAPEAVKSVYPKQSKVKGDTSGQTNVRVLTSEKTEIIQKPDQDEELPVAAAATFFGNEVD